MQGAVRFIRKNGRVIPIREKGGMFGSGSSKYKSSGISNTIKERAGMAYNKALMSREVERNQSFASTGAQIGMSIGLGIGSLGSSRSMMKGGLIGLGIGGIAGAAVGLSTFRGYTKKDKRKAKAAESAIFRMRKIGTTG